MSRDNLRAYSNRVLDGQISAQKKKLSALVEREKMLKKQRQELSNEELADRKTYTNYVSELKAEKGRRESSK